MRRITFVIKKLTEILRITGLSMAFIMIIGCDSEQNELTVGDEDWSFLVFGDMRQGFSIYDVLVKHMAAIKPLPALALCGGDIMMSPNNEIEWKAFWEHSKPITDVMPVFITRGNHEGSDPQSEKIFREQTRLKSSEFYYSYTVYNTRFIICDTEIEGTEGSIVGKQLEWLTNELNKAENNDSITNIFVCFHRPIFPQGAHYGDDMVNADELHGLLLQYVKLRAVFMSHDHIFNRLQKDGVEYITTGGAGANLFHDRGGGYHHFLKVSVTNKTNNINIKTIGLFNDVVEEFNL